MNKPRIQFKTIIPALLIAITLCACSSATPTATMATTRSAATTPSDPPKYEGSLPSDQPWYVNTR
jgi:hypothetical protein